MPRSFHSLQSAATVFGQISLALDSARVHFIIPIFLAKTGPNSVVTHTPSTLTSVENLAYYV